MKQKTYMGIDPSTSNTGYAILNERLEIIDKGVISGRADDPVAFHQLYKTLISLFRKHKPSRIVCEQQFVGRNINTTIKLARPTGVVLAAAGAILPESPFSFLVPATWRKLYHKGTDKEKRYTKQDSFYITQLRYPGIVTNFKKENDIADAIGLAFAAAMLDKEQ